MPIAPLNKLLDLLYQGSRHTEDDLLKIRKGRAAIVEQLERSVQTASLAINGVDIIRQIDQAENAPRLQAIRSQAEELLQKAAPQLSPPQDISEQ